MTIASKHARIITLLNQDIDEAITCAVCKKTCDNLPSFRSHARNLHRRFSFRITEMPVTGHYMATEIQEFIKETAEASFDLAEKDDRDLTTKVAKANVVVNDNVVDGAETLATLSDHSGSNSPHRSSPKSTANKPAVVPEANESQPPKSGEKNTNPVVPQNTEKTTQPTANQPQPLQSTAPPVSMSTETSACFEFAKKLVDLADTLYDVGFLTQSPATMKILEAPETIQKTIVSNIRSASRIKKAHANFVEAMKKVSQVHASVQKAANDKVKNLYEEIGKLTVLSEELRDNSAAAKNKRSVDFLSVDDVVDDDVEPPAAKKAKN
jgi:hypothetical protein